MKSQYKLTAGLLALLLVCFGVVILSPTVNAAGGGSITGAVKLTGTAPHMKGIDMSKDPVCSKAHESSPAKMENVIAGEGDGLANVVLYISQGLTGNEPASTQEPTFDQKGCMYTPHVLALDVGQKFKVTTGDQTTHNIHPLPSPSAGNIGWNKSQPPGAPAIETSWNNMEVAIPVKCNIHPWMHGWFVVVKGPYATTDDKGSYTIRNGAAGSYTVTAWQEDLGTQTAKVTVAAGSAAKADFTFKGK
jgi:hypothetical protein